MVVSDYFGNSDRTSQNFAFDNESPYIYYDSSYIPTTLFGEVYADNDQVQSQWIRLYSSSKTMPFMCDSNGQVIIASSTVNGTTNLPAIINCGDTPEREGISNGVSVTAYEAARVTYNNYEYLNKVYYGRDEIDEN